MPAKLIIAGSRTLYPSVEAIDTEVLRLPIWGDIQPDIARVGEVVSMVIGGHSLTTALTATLLPPQRKTAANSMAVIVALERP